MTARSLRASMPVQNPFPLRPGAESCRPSSEGPNPTSGETPGFHTLASSFPRRGVRLRPDPPFPMENTNGTVRTHNKCGVTAVDFERRAHLKGQKRRNMMLAGSHLASGDIRGALLHCKLANAAGMEIAKINLRFEEEIERQFHSQTAALWRMTGSGSEQDPVSRVLTPDEV